VSLPRRNNNDTKPGGKQETVNRTVNKISKKAVKQFNRKRRDWPLFNLFVLYGIKQAVAALFLADIVRTLSILIPYRPQLHNTLYFGNELGEMFNCTHDFQLPATP
jgi:hypothetical protein